jgi:hypothetical protein
MVMKIGPGFARRSSARRMLAGLLFVASAMMCSSASAEVVVTNCGAPIRSVVKSLVNSSFSTQSTIYANVTSARVVINVPDGQTQCVRVRFSASASCAVNVAGHRCYIKVAETSIIGFDPVVGFSSQPFFAAQSFEWATRLFAGSHTIQVQAATNSGTFNLANWTLAVDVAK